MFRVGDKVRINPTYASVAGALRLLEVTKIGNFGEIKELILLEASPIDKYARVGCYYLPIVVSLSGQQRMYCLDSRRERIRKPHRLTKIFI